MSRSFGSGMGGNGSGRGRGMGGNGSGRGMGRSGGGRGMGGGFGGGPSGTCICTQCGYTVPHQQGSSCTQQICPKCGGTMTRNIENHQFPAPDSSVKTPPKGNKAYIEEDLCKGCQICIPHCPEKAMEFKNGKVYIIESKCTGCFECINSCPLGSIKSKAS